MLVNPLELLPHRYPFLLVDQMEIVEPVGGHAAASR